MRRPVPLYLRTVGRQVAPAIGSGAMRWRNMMVVALPALAALLVLQPRAALPPQQEPSAAEVDAALRQARLEAGLPSTPHPRG